MYKKETIIIIASHLWFLMLQYLAKKFCNFINIIKYFINLAVKQRKERINNCKTTNILITTILTYYILHIIIYTIQ